jgi:hypothetical protein
MSAIMQKIAAQFWGSPGDRINAFDTGPAGYGHLIADFEDFKAALDATLEFSAHPEFRPSEEDYAWAFDDWRASVDGGGLSPSAMPKRRVARR